MTQKRSSWIAKWKYSGVLPSLLLTLLVFSFRPKAENTSNEPGHSSTTSITGVDGNSEKPIFPGCEHLNLMEIADCTSKSLNGYVADHLKYPEEMKKAKQEGKVTVGFEITKNGLVANAKIKMTLNPAADQAALDVVNSMNDVVGKWTPGTKDGIPVNMEMVLPISFLLGSESSTADGNGASVEQPNSSDEPFTFVEHMPTFPGGQAAMYEFLYKTIKYPALARANQVQGVVIIQFVVTEYGAIHYAKCVRGIGSGCNEEALRAVNAMPNWNPGQHEGKNVDVLFTLPIRFSLESDIPIEKGSAELSNQVKNPVVEVQFSPNPATDHITIELFEGVKSIIIYNAKGSLVIKKDLTETANKNYQLDISSLPEGVFTILVASNKETRSGSFTKVK